MSQWRSRAVAALVLGVLGAAFLSPLAASAVPSLSAGADVVFDGTAPFEDADGDTAHDPGDDLNGTNGVVRTMDRVQFQVNYAVQDVSVAEPSVGTMLTATLVGGPVWVPSTLPPASACPGPQGRSIDAADPAVLRCDLGDVTSSVASNFQVQAAVPMSAPDGSSVRVDVSLANAGGQVGSGSSVNTTVSASPRYEVAKLASGNPTATTRNGVQGYLMGYTLLLRDLSGDGRGLSALGADVVLDDRITAPSGLPYELVSCQDRVPAPASAVTHAQLTEDNARYVTSVSSATSCAQSGGSGQPITVTMRPDWARQYPPPTLGNSDVPYSGNTVGMVGSVALTLFISAADIDAVDGTVDGQGTQTVTNGLNTVTPFAPTDAQGVANNGGVAEPTANNSVSRSLNATTAGVGWRKGMSSADYVRPVRTFDGARWDRAGISFANTGLTVHPAGMIVCDKFDNSRFVIYTPVVTVSSATAGLVGAYQYGVGAWGASAADVQHGWYEQHEANCGDSDVPQWYTAAEVDFTNSGLGLVNAEDINAVRAVTIRDMQPGEGLNFWTRFEALDNDTGDYLLNTSAVYFPAMNGQQPRWVGTRCSSADDVARTCTVPTYPTATGTINRGTTPVPITGTNLKVDAAVHTAGPLQVTKATDGGDESTPMGEQRWRITVSGSNDIGTPGNYNSYAGPNATGVITPGVVVTDTLPVGMTPITAGTSPAWTSAVRNATTGVWTVTWSIGDIPVGTSRDVVLNTRVDYDSPIGVRTNNVRVTSSGIPSALGAFRGSTATATMRAATSLSAAVYKDVSAATMDPGDPLSFDLAFGNPSSSAVESADMVDLLPYNGDTRGTSSTGALQLSDVTVPTGVVAWVSFTAPGTLDTADGTTDGLVDVGSATYTSSPNAGTGSAWWPCRWDQLGTGACPAGRTAADVTALRFIGADPDPAASGPGDSFLAPQTAPQIIRLEFDTTAIQLGDVFANTFLAAFEGLVNRVRSGTAVQVSTAPAGALVIQTTVDKSTAQLGDTLTYQVMVENIGTAAATDLQLDDQLPAGVTFVSATGPYTDAGAGALEWTIPTLAAGDAETFTITARIDPAASQTRFVNTFGVDTPTGFRATQVNGACAADPARSCATTTIAAAPVNPGSMASTGVDVTIVVLTGLALLFLGVLFVAVAIQRRRTQS